MKKFTDSLSERVMSAGNVISEKASSILDVAKSSISTVATTVLDQNGDGELNQDDLKLLTKKGMKVVSSVASEAGRIAKEAASSELVKESAAAAAVGAAIAIPVPIIGPATGAVIGAAIGAYKNVTRK